MPTDWQGVVFIAVLFAVVSVGCRWVARSAVREMELLSRRPSTPQRGAVEGAGVERGSRLADTAAVLPRSPIVPAGGDPRPPSAGPELPAAAASRSTRSRWGPTPVGPVPEARVHRARKRVVFHG